jgi:hypothetical protein
MRTFQLSQIGHTGIAVITVSTWECRENAIRLLDGNLSSRHSKPTPSVKMPVDESLALAGWAWIQVAGCRQNRQEEQPAGEQNPVGNAVKVPISIAPPK